MIRLAHRSRKALIVLAIVVAFVAIVVPSCRMVGCSMSSGGGMSWGHAMADLGFFGTCGGEYITSTAPSAIVPAGADTLTLALIAAVFMAAAAYRPPLAVQRITSHPSDPPPPPTDPRGERLRV